LMGVQATIEIKTAGDETTLQVHADNSGLLIGRKGQTLEALQYLSTRIAGEHYAAEGPHIVVDIEKYRERRRKMLEDMALRLGEKAKRQRKTVTVEALSEADRKKRDTAASPQQQKQPEQAQTKNGEEPISAEDEDSQ